MSNVISCSKAAELLGVSRLTLRKHVAELGIRKDITILGKVRLGVSNRDIERLRRSIASAMRRSRLNRVTHGKAWKIPEYFAWVAMKQRCTNPNYRRYDRYGGRGISVCSRWTSSFETFLADVGPRPSPKHSLDRYPDPNGNYEPGNVRWATWSEQRRNQDRYHTHHCPAE